MYYWFTPKISGLVRSGQKILAIKELRQLTNTTLMIAKSIIDCWHYDHPVPMETVKSYMMSSYRCSSEMLEDLKQMYSFPKPSNQTCGQVCAILSKIDPRAQYLKTRALVNILKILGDDNSYAI